MIPIEMFVSNDKVEEVMTILSLFQDRVNAKAIELVADYKTESNSKYSLLLTYNLPDDDSFSIINGINGKLINFQINANITLDVIFGNDITYELSIDGGNKYEKLIRYDVEPNKNVDEYSDQQINKSYATSLPKSTIWSLSLSAIVKKNSMLENLIVLTDIPYEIFDSSFLTNSFLKINYNFRESFIPNKKIPLKNGAFTYDFYLTYDSIIDLSKTKGNLSKLGDNEILFYFDDNNYAISLNNTEISIKKKNINDTYSKIFIIFDGSTFSTTEYKQKNLSYIGNGQIKFNNFKKHENIKSNYNLFSDIEEEIENFIDIIYPKYFIKPIIINNISYDAEFGENISLTLEFKDRMIQ